MNLPPLYDTILRTKLLQAKALGRAEALDEVARSGRLVFAADAAAVAAAPEPLDPEAARLLMQAMLLAGDDADTVLSEFKTRTVAGRKLAFSVAWNESQHPRDDHGRFVRGAAIAAARRDPAYAKRLRAGVNDPEERAKLDALIRHRSGRTQGLSVHGSKGKQDLQQSHDKVKELAEQAKSGTVTHEHLRQLADMLNGHTMPELAELKKRLGLPAAGLKVEQVNNLLDKAVNAQAAGGIPKRADGTPQAPQRQDVYTVSPKALKADPARFQYKVSGIKEGGVTDELKGTRTYNPELGGVLLAWRDPADGQDYVVNGHHRFELATRTGAPAVNVRYIDAPTDVEARARGALANIAEGRGTATDAAKYLRDSGQGLDHLKNAGISLSGKVAADAANLKDLSDKSFAALTAGTLDEATAATVAKHLKDPGRQDVLFQKIAQREEEGKGGWNQQQLETAAKKMARAGTVTTSGNDLFGAFEEEHPTFDQEVELESHVRQALRREVGDFTAVANTGRAERVAGAGNVLAVDENQKRKAEAADRLADFERESGLKSAVSEAIKQGAGELAAAKTKKEKDGAKQRTLDAVRAALSGQSVPADPGAGGRSGAVDAGAAGPAAGGADRSDGAAGGRAVAGRPAADLSDAKGPFYDALPDHLKPVPGAPDHDIEKVTLERAKAHYAEHRDAYLKKGGGVFNDAGELQGMVLNTDDWRELFPEYTGTNAHAVHEASSHLNKEAFKEGLSTLAGKGNGRMLILAGGGGSGKGTVTRDHVKAAEYPLTLDQVSDSYNKLAQKFDEAKAAGFTPEYYFVDRQPDQALGGVIGRALNARSRGELARTVPLDMAFTANMQARKVALQVLKDHADIEPKVLDNTKGAGRTRLVMGQEAIAHIENGIREDEEHARTGTLEKMKQNVADRHRAGEIDADIAAGLLGPAEFKRLVTDHKGETDGRAGVPGPGPVAADDAAGTDAGVAADAGRAQPGPTAGGGAERGAAGRGAESDQGGTGAEAGAVAVSPHRAALDGMKPGDKQFVAGYHVTKNADGTHAVQTGKKTFRSGTADEIAAHIADGWQRQSWQQKSIDAALQRADSHPESSPFDAGSRERYEAESRKLRAVPDGIPAVSLGEATRGRVGTVKTGDDGVKRLHLDDSPDEFATEAFEPLDPKHSYRVADLTGPAKKSSGRTGSLLDQAAGEPSAGTTAGTAGTTHPASSAGTEGKAGTAQPEPPALAATGPVASATDAVQTLTPNAAPEPAEEEIPPTPPTPKGATDAPHVSLASHLADVFRNGQAPDAKRLFAAANQHFGGTRADGKYGPTDAYDALEAGFNRSLVGETDPAADLATAQEQARGLAARVNALPTQTNRSGNKDSFQQFSTPPHFAYAAVWAANLKPGEHVLEPSAGTGSLAVQAANAGAVVHANELDPKRADHLRQVVDPANVHTENAEQISGILPGRGTPAPTAVVMNPPFSQTAGRMGDKKELMTGARHIEEAANMLAPGGRLVAIVGRGMTPDAPTYKEWFDRMKQTHSLRANVGVEGDEYKKYGTGFGTRLLVFDKTGPHQGDTVTGDAADIPDLMQKLEGVRNDRRTDVAAAPPGERAGGGGPAGAGAAGGGNAVPAAATGAGAAADAGAPAAVGGAAGAGGPGAANAVSNMLTRLGVAQAAKPHDSATVHQKLSSGAATATLANGWKLKPVRVQGERRIEVDGPSGYHAAELMQDGVVKERVGYDTRFFVPTGADGAKVLERITKSRPVTEVLSAAAAKD